MKKIYLVWVIFAYILAGCNGNTAAMQIASIHNLAFYLWLAGEARKHIIAGDFSTWKPMMVKRVSTRL